MNITRLNKTVEKRIRLGKAEYEQEKTALVKQKQLAEEMAHRRFEKGEITGSEFQSILQNLRSKYGKTLESLQDKHSD